MFFDYTKRAMITVERRLEVSHEDFKVAQAHLVQDLTALMQRLSYRVVPGSDPTARPDLTPCYAPVKRASMLREPPT